jgi:hypothetical protein
VSVRSTSSISARTRRVTSVIWNSLSVIDGSTRALRPDAVSSPVRQKPRLTTSPRPKEGSTSSQTEKMQDQQDADQEGRQRDADKGDGEEDLDSQLSMDAGVDPMGMPSATANRAAAKASLDGSGQALGNQADHRLLHLVVKMPKSNRTALPTKRANCV